MSLYAAFLRGMNVGGHRLTSDGLRGHFLAMGFTEVASFRASGNVVFAAEGRSQQQLTEQVERGLASLLGYAVPTFVRSERELRTIASRKPFAAEQVRAAGGKLQVSLLGSSPSPEVRSEVLALAGEQDALAFGERELYWLPSGGVLESSLDLRGIERLLGPSTMRTKGTIELITSRHFAQ
ncbi:MAG: DUF1697 domain-containing protein [Solirubrobacteraceae bacterium]